MYHPEIVDRRLKAFQSKAGISLKRYSASESIERQDALQGILDLNSGMPSRHLSEEEQGFVLNEMVLSKYDFKYWAERYAWLNSPYGELKRIQFWESQEVALGHISDGELNAWKNGGDNLWDWLKARQLGATQVCATLISHRLFFWENQRAIVASDEPDHSLELSRRIEKIFDKMPWWSKPRRKFHVKGTEMFFDLMNCSLVVGHGKKEGGGLGQGQTTNIFHFSELPDWQNFTMIEEDFLPTVPIHPTSIGVLESTARGRHDNWHDHFKLAWDGKSRFKAFFIPWYAEPTRYRMRPPSGWIPNKLTQLHAKAVENESPKYMRGRTVHLDNEQLFFWEFTRNEYEKKGRLYVFLQEYASNHLECFQSANIGMFDGNLMQKMMAQVHPFVAYEVVTKTGGPSKAHQHGSAVM